MQVTINGMPLYTYVGDSAAGQANGQAVNAYGNLWYIVQHLTGNNNSKGNKFCGSSGGAYSY